MRWLKFIDSYSTTKKSSLRVVHPRSGTCVIPLKNGDEDIFFDYLTARVHSLFFEGPEDELTNLLFKMRDQKGFVIQKMKTCSGRKSQKMIHLHLKLSDNQELRRLIKLKTH